MMQLLRASDDPPLHERPLWERGDLDREALLLEFRRECRIVRRGLEGDLAKACPKA